MIFKVTQNIRVNRDFNVSVSIEEMISDEQEAHELGKTAYSYVTEYLEGYTEDMPETEDDEDTGN